MNDGEQPQEQPNRCGKNADEHAENDFCDARYTHHGAQACAHKEKWAGGNKLNSPKDYNAEAEHPRDSRNAHRGKKQQHNAEQNNHDAKKKTPSALRKQRIAIAHIRRDVDAARNDDANRDDRRNPHEHFYGTKNAHQAKNKHEHTRKKLHPVDRAAASAWAEFAAGIKHLHADFVVRHRNLLQRNEFTSSYV